jgi:AraC-like DNA-binding protein
MLYRYDIDKLEKVLRDFHEITGITVAILDTQFRHLAYYPKPKSQFCELIQQTEEGRRRCYASDAKLLSGCMEKRCPVHHHCHAGLSDTVVPILNGQTLIGFILFGQIREDTKERIPFEEIFANVSDLGIHRETLKNAYDELVFLDQARVKSASEIVSMLTKYIYVERLIELEHGSMEMERIVQYIDSNLTEKLSVALLCREFNLSKNALYKLFKLHIDQPVKEYINSRRLHCAEKLLQTTELPVYEVCERCGIDNYQYFCRMFKREKGETPLQYRKKQKTGFGKVEKNV